MINKSFTSHLQLNQAIEQTTAPYTQQFPLSRAVDYTATNNPYAMQGAPQNRVVDHTPTSKPSATSNVPPTTTNRGTMQTTPASRAVDHTPTTRPPSCANPTSDNYTGTKWRSYTCTDGDTSWLISSKQRDYGTAPRVPLFT